MLKGCCDHRKYNSFKLKSHLNKLIHQTFQINKFKMFFIDFEIG